VDCCFVADREFVEVCGHAPVAFEPVDPALDRVSLLVDVWLEYWWSASCPATVAALPDLVSSVASAGTAQDRPLRVGQISSPRHRWAGHLVYLINDTPHQPPCSTAPPVGAFETGPIG